MPRTTFASPPRRRRSPVSLVLLLVLAAVIGLLLWLGLRSTATPQHQIEQDVTNDVAAR
jgi:hypothetical protein